MSNVNPQFLKLVHNVDYFTILEFSLRKLNCEAIFASSFFFFTLNLFYLFHGFRKSKGEKRVGIFPFSGLRLQGEKVSARVITH